MKQRFTYLDIRSIVNELSPLITNAYLQNIYSINNRTYVFKLSTKHLLLLEVGARLHLTNEINSESLTHFCTKMRPLLRRNIIKAIEQVGFDRVIKITTNRYFIYFEFFSSGNIIITDFDNLIIELFRPVKELNMEKNTLYIVNPITLDFGIDMFYKIGIHMLGLDKIINDDIKKELDEKLNTKGYFIKNHDGNERIFKNDKLMEVEELKESEDFNLIYNSFFDSLIEKFEQEKNFGAVFMKKDKPNLFIPYQLKYNKIENSFSSFNEALQFYYKKEEQKEVKKSNVVKQRQEKRIEDLENQVAAVDTKVALMYEHKNEIEKILIAHKNVIDYSLDWKDFEKHKEKQTGLKEKILKSDFSKKTCLIKLDEFIIEFNFMINFNMNINLMYENKKKMKDKLEKTKSNIKSVVKKLEKKDMKKVVKKEKISRKVYWFEKFNYCFTSTGKLIISGKNAQQNDILVKKYMEKDDLYFHAEIQGGASVILKKNQTSFTDDDINEAGHVALCNSNAWKSKVTCEVYYVDSNQVSKTTESGEYVKKGGFVIRGKKNFVDAFRLEYGIGILFKPKIDEIEEKIKDLQINSEAENTSIFLFTSKPIGEIEHAILVCAPWKIIKTYKYKEKLVPGMEKKGKLANEILKRMNNYIKNCENPNEINAVKNIVLDEYVNVLIGNARIGKQ